MSARHQIAAQASLIEQLMADRNFEDLSKPLTELQTAQVTREHLEETHVVRAVYRVLKSCPSVAWRKKAKSLLADWKALYKAQWSLQGLCPEVQTEENSALSPEPTQHEGLGVTCSDHLFLSQPIAQAKAAEAVMSGNSTDHAQLGAVDSVALEQRTGVLPDSTVAVRAKCAELLCDALASSSAVQPPVRGWSPFAQEIEEHVFSRHSKDLRKYKACIRSKVANLKNPKNSHLQQNLRSGTTSPREFAEMSTLAMAHEELQQLRTAYTEAGIQEHALPQVVEGTHTRKIKCRRCEQFNCKVTVIARGALFLPSWVRNASPDEEMMTYVICNECGEQWYHSKWVCL